MKSELKQNLEKTIRLRIFIFLALILVFLNSADAQISEIKQVDFKKNFHSKQFSLLRVTYGDLTGDKTKEAAVLLRSKDSRKPNQDKILIYSFKNGKAVKLIEFAAGQRGEYVLSIESLESNFRIEEKIFVLDLAVLQANECIPTQYYTIKYRWNGHQMEELERSTLKILPENMREIG